MPDLLASVAGLTALHERDRLDAAVVGLLAQWLEPAALALYARVGPAAAPRLLRLASARRGQPVRPGEPAWTPLEALPLADERPELRPALDEGASQFDGPLPPLPAAPGEPLLRSVFPVGLGGRRRGVLELVAERPLDAEARRFVAGVLQIYRNQLSVLDYGERDTLTGLLNRKTFENQFGKLRDEMPIDGSRPCWMGLVDVDRFKAVNDGYGHVFGDEVLLLVSQIIQRSFRGNDRVYRFGGEEFVILLRDAPEHAVNGALERLRSAVERHRFPQIGTITVSVGWTKIRPQDMPATAIERADGALYHAKACGRNQVIQHEQLVADGRLGGSKLLPVAEIELF